MSDTWVEGSKTPRRGDEVRAVIERLDKKGLGVAHMSGKTLRVRSALPGQTVLARVTRRRRDQLDGILLDVLARGPHWVPPRCGHVPVCGGCAFQDLAYDAQVAAKFDHVTLALEAARLEVVVDPVLRCDEPFAYRNKMEFSFGSHRWVESTEPEGADRSFALGLHVAGRFDRILDVQRCEIVFPEGSRLVETVRRLARAHGLTAWDVHRHAGLLRYLVVRKGYFTGEVMVHLVTSELAADKVGPLLDALVATHPELTTVVQSVNSRPADVALGTDQFVHFGSGVIHECLGDLRFAISPHTFFQTNSPQARKLFELVQHEAAPEGHERVWDLYCGAGSLTLMLARRAREVVGFEIVASAVEDARRNAALNGVSNVRFVLGDVLASLSEHEGEPPADVLVVDPPRAGLHRKVLPLVLAAPARRLVYVSCNVHATAPQISQLVQGGAWRLVRVQPVDMFPHTPHVECVFTLERCS